MQERNESLFYYVLSKNLEELLPIVHMPTVSQYCQLYGLMFRSLPRSLFISMRDKGRLQQPESAVRVKHVYRVFDDLTNGCLHNMLNIIADLLCDQNGDFTGSNQTEEAVALDHCA